MELQQRILVRLLNNDRIIGQLLHIDKNSIAIFAPMLIKQEIIEDQLDITLFPYDPLSETVMAIFELFHTLTFTTPKQSLVDLYDKHWTSFYPELNDVKKSIYKKYNIEEPESSSEGSKKLH